MKLKAVIILLIICSITFASTIVFAVDSFSEATSSAETWLNGGKGESPIDQNDVAELSNTIWSAIMIIGTVLAVIIAMVLGIQFMLGSTEQKAEVKEKLIPFIVGCVILFGSAGIWKLAMNLLKTVQDQTDTTTIPSYVTDREEQEEKEEALSEQKRQQEARKEMQTNVEKMIKKQSVPGLANITIEKLAESYVYTMTYDEDSWETRYTELENALLPKYNQITSDTETVKKAIRTLHNNIKEYVLATAKSENLPIFSESDGTGVDQNGKPINH